VQDGIVHMIRPSHSLHHFLFHHTRVGGIGEVIQRAQIEHDGVGEVARRIQQDQLLQAGDRRANLLHIQCANGEVVDGHREVAAVHLCAALEIVY